MSESSSVNLRNLVAACAAISVFGLAFGMTYPLLSLILESRQVSPQMIGINSAMMPLGILLFASVIPVAAKRFGSRNVAIVAAIVTSLLILAYRVFDTLEAWFIIRLLQGMSISTLFILSEAWIVAFAGDKHRGKVVAIYGSILSASFGAGPAIIGWIGIDGWAPFVIGAVVIALGVIPLLFVDEQNLDEPKDASSAGFFNFASKAPLLLACVFAFAILDASTLSLLPIYGIYNGLDLTTAALALTALIVGNIVLQFPIGWLADNFSGRLVLAGCALVAAIMLAILPYVMNHFLMWPVLVVAGASGYGVYTVSLTLLGERFKGADLIQGSAAFAIIWGVGALVGSVSGGWAMTLFGPHGLPFHLVFVYGVLVVGLIMRSIYVRKQSR